MSLALETLLLLENSDQPLLPPSPPPPLLLAVSLDPVHRLLPLLLLLSMVPQTAAAVRYLSVCKYSLLFATSHSLDTALLLDLCNLQCMLLYTMHLLLHSCNCLANQEYCWVALPSLDSSSLLPLLLLALLLILEKQQAPLK